MVRGRTNITGVVEITEYKPTIDLARSLLPRARRIGVITDASVNGISNKKKFAELAEKYAGILDFDFFDDENGIAFDKLLAKVRSFSKDDFIYFVDYYVDGKGVYYNYADVVPLVAQEAPCPVVYHADMYIGFGVLGGRMTRSYDHGALAANMVSDALERNVPAGSIPVFDKALTRNILSYDALKRFDIPLSRTPADSLVYNRPQSSWVKFGRALSVAGAVFLFLFAVICMLAVNIRKREKAEKQAADLATDLAVTLNSIGDGVIVTDTAGRVVRMNPVARFLTGYTNENFELQDIETVFPIYNSVSGKKAINPVRRVMSEGIVMDLANHTELRSRSGEIYHIADSAAPIIREDDTLIGAILVFRDVTEKYKTNMALQDSLREKEVLLKEIHHRVKNNMQIVSSILSLQNSLLADEAAKNALLDSMMRVASMSLIHEYLYRSENFSRIRFGEYLKNLTQGIEAAYLGGPKDIKVVLDVDDIEIDIDRAIPIGLIVNECVTNAMKHAFKERSSGRVTVSLKKSEEGLRITISDDGAGLPAGKDTSDMNTLGFRLIDALTDQLKGKRTIENSKPGLTVVFSLPRI
jgi:PAS domain S-box-containing protein